MDIQGDVNKFVTQGRELFDRLQSAEGGRLSPVDLYVLRVQLHLLDNEAVSLQNLQSFRRKRQACSDGSDGESRAA